MDLLSDEGTNRTLLLWLKMWDKLVFNREKKQRARPAAAKPEVATAPGGGGGQTANKWRPGGNLPEVVDKLDEAGRPQQRVALLHGPPGLGKTTLAHIVASHAGYKVGT
jgi:chromosome transmission fidelity protein 18